MRQTRQSGLEGGARFNPLPRPLSLRGRTGVQRRFLHYHWRMRKKERVLVAAPQSLNKRSGVIAPFNFGATVRPGTGFAPGFRLGRLDLQLSNRRSGQ